MQTAQYCTPLVVARRVLAVSPLIRTELKNRGHVRIGDNPGTTSFLNTIVYGDRSKSPHVGGPAHQLNPAFSFFVRCDSQKEIDSYWGKLIEGGKPMACGWLTDRFGLCWQIVPRNIGELISHPKAMEAMMGMIRMDLPALEAAAREN